ncbi:MAG: hypothetical protein CMF41_02390 [Legionellales bacterium]|nr:hypothetical protein [Legionellales bacterium]
MFFWVAAIFLAHAVISDYIFFAHFIAFLCLKGVDLNELNSERLQSSYFEIMCLILPCIISILFYVSTPLLLFFLGFMGAFSFPTEVYSHGIRLYNKVWRFDSRTPEDNLSILHVYYIILNVFICFMGFPSIAIFSQQMQNIYSVGTIFLFFTIIFSSNSLINSDMELIHHLFIGISCVLQLLSCVLSNTVPPYGLGVLCGLAFFQLVLLLIEEVGQSVMLFLEKVENSFDIPSINFKSNRRQNSQKWSIIRDHYVDGFDKMEINPTTKVSSHSVLFKDELPQSPMIIKKIKEEFKLSYVNASSNFLFFFNSQNFTALPDIFICDDVSTNSYTVVQYFYNKWFQGDKVFTYFDHPAFPNHLFYYDWYSDEFTKCRETISLEEFQKGLSVFVRHHDKNFSINMKILSTLINKYLVSINKNVNYFRSPNVTVHVFKLIQYQNNFEYHIFCNDELKRWWSQSQKIGDFPTLCVTLPPEYINNVDEDEKENLFQSILTKINQSKLDFPSFSNHSLNEETSMTSINGSFF